MLGINPSLVFTNQICPDMAISGVDHIYIYIYMYRYMCIYIYISLSLSCPGRMVRRRFTRPSVFTPPASGDSEKSGLWRVFSQRLAPDRPSWADAVQPRQCNVGDCRTGCAAGKLVPPINFEEGNKRQRCGLLRCHQPTLSAKTLHSPKVPHKTSEQDSARHACVCIPILKIIYICIYTHIVCEPRRHV